MSLSAEYNYSYRAIGVAGETILPSPFARNPYLWCSWSLFYFLVTEAEESQIAEVGSADGYAPNLSDTIVICI